MVAAQLEIRDGVRIWTLRDFTVKVLNRRTCGTHYDYFVGKPHSLACPFEIPYPLASFSPPPVQEPDETAQQELFGDFVERHTIALSEQDYEKSRIERERERTEVIELYRAWLVAQLAVEESTQAHRIAYLSKQLQIASKSVWLACWCAPHACHADIIAQVLLQGVCGEG